MKKDKRGNLLLLTFFGIIVVSWIIFFTVVLVVNNKRREYKGTIAEADKTFPLELTISQTWVNGAGDGMSYGQQFDFVIKNDNRYNLKNWKLVVSIDVSDFEIVELGNFWNVEYELDNNTFTFTAIKDIDLVNISPDKANAFGGIITNKNGIYFTDEFVSCGKADDFSNISYTLTGTLHRTITSYSLFWVLIFLTFTYVAFAISYAVILVREKHFDNFKNTSYSIISQAMNTFGSLIDTKDPYTKDHSARVSYYSTKLARKMGLDDDFCTNIAYIALMHDCGKLVINDDLLIKPSTLTPEEMEVMKMHTTYGGAALENFTSIKGIQDGAMYHHERYDGTGYPVGLVGEEIPLCARIIAVADALDAMSSDRCYRKRLTEEKILSELRENAGTQFDPHIAELAIEMIENHEINVFDTRIRSDKI